MDSPVERLLSALPNGGSSGESIDWGVVEQSWGTPFPEDFKAFMGKYGRGTIDNILAIATPMDGIRTPGVLRCRNLTPTTPIECRVERRHVTYPAWPAPGSLIGWGTTGGGLDLYWCTRSEAPALWTIVVRAYHGGSAAEHRMGMVEFLVRMLGSRQQRPDNIPDILGSPHSRFIHADEESRIRRTGIDPWEYLDEFDATEDED